MNDDERPVLSGLVALVAVAAVVGLLMGLAALVGTRVLGVGGDDEAAGGPTGNGDTLYLPKPVPTEADTGPQFTLAPGEETRSAPSSPQETKSEKPKEQISLSASQTAVSAMERIDLTGVYPTGEGAILQVQRLEDGQWEDFPVTASVSGGTFSTYVQTGQSGENKFRVVDSNNGEKSNAVKVQVG